MKYMRKQLPALLVALAMILLAGCGGSQVEDTQASDAPAPSEEVTPAQSGEVQPEAASPAETRPEVQEPADNQQEEIKPAEIQPEETAEADPASEPEADPEPASEPEPVPESTPEPEPESVETVMEDGTYTASVTLEGGSGRATVESPAVLRCENGQFYATIVWSSPNFDYMKVDGEKYLPINTEGNSTFKIPVADFDRKLDVIADTVAMSEPHEVEYTLTFDSATLQRQ